MGWLQDRIREVVKDELALNRFKSRHHACTACGLVYDRHPDDYYLGKFREQDNLEWLFCKPCREKYRHKDTLLEWAKANRTKVQALKDKVEGKGRGK